MNLEIFIGQTTPLESLKVIKSESFSNAQTMLTSLSFMRITPS